MSGFRNATVFGLKIGFNLSELRQDANETLKNLSLEPNDFRRLQNIGNVTSGIPNTFQKISNLSENLLLKSDSLRSETSAYTGVLDRLYQTSPRNPFIAIEGNLNVNGRLIAKSITQKTFNETSKSFITSPITTAINSAWDTTGTTISLGQGLVIESHADAKLVTGRLKNVQAFESRRFGTEKATHKIKIKIGGTDYFMYAIKNNPFKLEGSFGNATKSNLQITSSPASDVNYVASFINTGGTTIERPVVKIPANEATSADAISTLQTGTTLIVYANPEKVNSFTMTSQGLTELPEGIIFGEGADAAAPPTTVNLSFNNFTTFPKIKKVFPSFTKVSINQSDGDIAKRRKIVITNFDDISNNLPTGITEFNAQATFKPFPLRDAGSPDFPADFGVAPFANLTVLNLNHNDLTEFTPAIGTSLTSLQLFNNSFTELSAESLPANNSLTSINLGENSSLEVSADTPVESHPYYDNNTYNSGLTSFKINRTKLGIPDLQNKNVLSTFTAENVQLDGQGTVNDDVRFQIVSTKDNASTSKFSGCTALKILRLRISRVHGPIPSFSTNTVLNELNLEGTALINPVDDSPTGSALAEFGFPQSLRIFKYSYANGEFTAAGGTSNSLPSSAFQYLQNNTPKLIPFTTLTYRSDGITGGKCPALQGVDVDVSDNAFTSIVNISADVEADLANNVAALNLASFNANDNKLAGPLNLNNLFAGTEYTDLKVIGLSNNEFDSFNVDSISNTKFPALETLNLKNSFTDDTPTNLELRKFAGLSTLKTIDVSENAFDTVQSSLFDGCTSLTQFGMDTTSFAQLDTVIGSIESLVNSTSGTTSRTFSFSSSSDKVNIKIPNVNTFGKSTYSADEQAFFRMNDRIRSLQNKSVSIDNILLDDAYAALPAPPQNLTAVNNAVGECTLTFSTIANADRIIIIKVRDGVDVEIAGPNNDSPPPGLPANTTTFVDTDFDEQTDARYRVHGENIRSIINSVINDSTVQAPSDSPPHN